MMSVDCAPHQVSGGRLPKHFRIANEYGVRGGIDPAFMSTTLDRAVALTYAASSNGPGVVFSMRQGMVDRGSDIGLLSQYPHEMEILFAPLTGLEIHSIAVDGTVLVPEIRLSVNLNAATIEQVGRWPLMAPDWRLIGALMVPDCLGVLLIAPDDHRPI